MRTVLAGVAFALLPALVRADTDPDVAVPGPVVVTATRTPEPVSQTIHPVTVINANEIESAGQQTLTEVLRARGGLETSSTGGHGQPSSVFLRGANSTQTLVLLDGIRINSTVTGTIPFETIRNNQLARIEIVPGALSSLYGSEAIGGVIQLFTHRWPAADRVQAAAGYGTYNTSNVHAGFAGGTERVGLTIHAGYLATDGFSATNPDVPFEAFNPDRDDYANSNVSGSFVYRFAPEQEIGVSAFYTDASTRFDGGPSTDDKNNQRLGVYSLYANNRVRPWWQSRLRLGASQDETAVEGSFPGYLRSDQRQATWQNDFSVPSGTLIAGVEYLDQAVDTDTPFAVDRREVYSVFGGYSGQIGSSTLQASVRNDDYSQFGNQTTFSLGYAYRVARQWRLRASGGTGFHAPTFSDLYFPGFGNPALNPETSRSWDVGVDYNIGAHRFGATYFNNRIDGLVVFDAATLAPQNLGQARIEGVELGYDGVLLGVEASVRITLQDPRDARTGALLPRRSKAFGSVTLARQLGRWRFGGEVVGSDERFDSIDEDPTTRLAPYAILNLVATYAPAPNWTVEARWDNVFDTDYALARGYNTPGSNIFVAIRYRLK